MARRTSIVDNLMRMPWQHGLMIATGAYMVIRFASPAFLGTNPTLNPIATAIGKNALLVCLPIFFAVGLSVLRQLFEGALFKRQTSLESVRSLSWRQFESIVCEAFRRQGYEVFPSPEGADGGYDVLLKKDGSTTLVQCKHWKKNRVGVAIVRELVGVMRLRNVTQGVIVCTGQFTNDADETAQAAGIQLVGAQELSALVPVARVVIPKTLRGSAYVCPRCGSGMVRRVARRGPKRGRPFLGCTRYPKCKEIRDLGP